MTLDRATLREVLDRYIDGERPAAIAAALGLDAAEVERLCLPPTSAGAVAKAALGPRPKRAKAKVKADKTARAGAAPADVADPAAVAGRDGVTSHRNHGFGYVTLRGGRKWL